MSQIKSKERVSEHGEVFTPPWLVDKMLDLVGDESFRIDSRVLEPACGDGNFLTATLKRKLVTVQHKFGKSEFERKHYALLAVMSLYGIELLPDNIQECRENVQKIFNDFFHNKPDENLRMAAKYVLSQNLVQGDAMSMKTPEGESIILPEWGYLGKGKFQRRDFRFGDLTETASKKSPNSIFNYLPDDQLFTPVTSYKPKSINQIAELIEAQEVVE